MDACLGRRGLYGCGAGCHHPGAWHLNSWLRDIFNYVGVFASVLGAYVSISFGTRGRLEGRLSGASRFVDSRRWLRWAIRAAGLCMIGIVAFYIGSWAYGHFQANQLQAQVEQGTVYFSGKAGLMKSYGEYEGVGTLMSIPVLGGPVTSYTSALDFYGPSYSPDDNSLVCTGETTESHQRSLYLLSSNGTAFTDTEPVELAQGSQAAFHPTENLFVYVDSSGSLCTYDAENKNSKPIVTPMADEVLLDPSWSVDGTELAYVIQTGGRSTAVVVKWPDCSEVARLNENRPGYSVRFPVIMPVSVEGHTKLAVAIESGDQGQESEIMIKEWGPDGNDQVTSLVDTDLFPVTAPSLSPDSRRLAFLAKAKGIWNLVVKDLDTDELDWVGPAALSRPAWNRSGDRVVFGAADTGTAYIAEYDVVYHDVLVRLSKRYDEFIGCRSGRSKAELATTVFSYSQQRGQWGYRFGFLPIGESAMTTSAIDGDFNRSTPKCSCDGAYVAFLEWPSDPNNHRGWDIVIASAADMPDITEVARFHEKGKDLTAMCWDPKNPARLYYVSPGTVDAVVTVEVDRPAVQISRVNTGQHVDSLVVSIDGSVAFSTRDGTRRDEQGNPLSQVYLGRVSGSHFVRLSGLAEGLSYEYISWSPDGKALVLEAVSRNVAGDGHDLCVVKELNGRVISQRLLCEGRCPYWAAEYF
jgi:Tol biopolymer transport system component